MTETENNIQETPKTTTTTRKNTTRKTEQKSSNVWILLHKSREKTVVKGVYSSLKGLLTKHTGLYQKDKSTDGVYVDCDKNGYGYIAEMHEITE